MSSLVDIIVGRGASAEMSMILVNAVYLIRDTFNSDGIFTCAVYDLYI